MPIERVRTFLGVTIPFSRRRLRPGHIDTFIDTDSLENFGTFNPNFAYRSLKVESEDTIVIHREVGISSRLEPGQRHIRGNDINREKEWTMSKRRFGFRTVYRHR